MDHAISNERYEVLVVKYGTRMSTRADIYLNYSIYRTPDGPLGMDYFVWVVRNSHYTAVIDTGFSVAGGAARGRTTLANPPRLLAELGVEAADAPDVVVTHAHYDHIGNLDHFATSWVVIARSEYDFWTSPMARRAQFHHSVEDRELAVLERTNADGRLVAFDGRYELAPGIEVIEVGGHTPGQSVVRVQTNDGPVLLASDAIHYYEEYEQDMPFTHVADLPRTYRGFDAIRGMCERGEVATIVSGHDPETMARLGADPTATVARLGATS